MGINTIVWFIVCMLNYDSEDITAENRVRKKRIFLKDRNNTQGMMKTVKELLCPGMNDTGLAIKSSRIRKATFEETAKGDSEC